MTEIGNPIFKKFERINDDFIKMECKKCKINCCNRWDKIFLLPREREREVKGIF